MFAVSRTARAILFMALIASCARTPLRLPPSDGGDASDAGLDNSVDAGAISDAGDGGTDAGQLTWRTPFLINDGDAGFASNVAVALNALGSTDVIWTASSGTATFLRGSRVDTDGGVSPHQNIASFDGGVILNPRVSTNASSVYSAATFLYAMDADAGVPREMWAARRSNTWSSALVLDFSSSSITFPSVARVGAESFLATWLNFQSIGSLRISKSDGASPTWLSSALDAGNPMMMGAATTDDGAQNAMTALNNCMMSGGQMSCQVTVQWNSGGGWQSPFRADTAGGEIMSSPFIGAANATAAIAWIKRGLAFFDGEIWAAHCSTSGCWGAQALKSFPYVNPDFLHADGPHGIDIRMNSAGASLLLFAERDAGVFMSHAPTTASSWSAATKLVELPAGEPVAAATDGEIFAAAWRKGSTVYAAWVGAATTMTNVAPVSFTNGATTVSDLKLGRIGNAVLLVWAVDGNIWGVLAN